MFTAGCFATRIMIVPCKLMHGLAPSGSSLRRRGVSGYDPRGKEKKRDFTTACVQLRFTIYDLRFCIRKAQRRIDADARRSGRGSSPRFPLQSMRTTFIQKAVGSSLLKSRLLTDLDSTRVLALAKIWLLIHTQDWPTHLWGWSRYSSFKFQPTGFSGKRFRVLVYSVCVGCLFLRSPSRIPYRTESTYHSRTLPRDKRCFCLLFVVALRRICFRLSRLIFPLPICFAHCDS